MSTRTFAAQSTSTLSVPPGSYIYTIIPSAPTHLSSISSDDSVRTFSRETLTQITCIPAAHSGITSLAPGTSPHTFLTAGRDSLVKLWDSRANPASPASNIFHAGAPVLSLATHPGTGLVVAGTELRGRVAKVCAWDPRVGSALVREYVDSHSDDVACVCMPGDGRWVVSGGMDGLINAFDTTAAPGTASGDSDDENALWQVIGLGSSVHKVAAFGEGAGAWVAGVSHDEVLKVHPFEVPGTKPRDGDGGGDIGDVRGKLECEYVIDLLGRGEEGTVVVGRKGEEVEQGQKGEAGWVDLVTLRRGGDWAQWGFGEERVRLHGGHGTEVCRGIWIDWEAGTVFTCGEDGLVKVWRKDCGASGAEGVPKREKDKERRRVGEREKARFKPY